MKNLSHTQRFFIATCLLTIFLSQKEISLNAKLSPIQWIRWGATQIGQLTGLHYQWNLFTFADRHYDRPTVVGSDIENKNISLNILNKKDSSFFWKWISSFREEQFLANLKQHPRALDAYLEHICRNHENLSLSRVRIEVQRFPIAPLHHAQQTGQALGPMKLITHRDYSCFN